MTDLVSDSVIEIRPEVTILSVLKSLNYKPWFAIAEFIDNAIQSAIANEARLRQLHNGEYLLKIDIGIEPNGPGEITISDNAAGIHKDDFPRAFRTAQKPPNQKGLSEFGMGMKSAACWFANVWSVRTKALGESVERTVNFHIDSIVENKVETVAVQQRMVDPAAHYTVLSLRNLHHPPQGRTIGKIRSHLASIYRVYLCSNRLSIKLNGDLLSYEPPKILNCVPYLAPGVPSSAVDTVPVEWRKEINFDFGAGQKVTGFAALREVGSTYYAGFSLFRRDRLILGSYDETYRPAYIFKQTTSYLYQRLFGELHLEGFDVSHTKDGFRWEHYEDTFLECLKEVLEAPPLNLLVQAENYRALPQKRTIEAQAAVATAKVINHIKSEVGPLLVNARENPAIVPVLPKDIVNSIQQASEREIAVDDGEYQWVISLRTSIDPAREQWILLSKAENKGQDKNRVRRLIIDLSLAHPFSVKFIGAHNENVELFLRVATGVCISLILSEDLTGEPAESVLYHFNYLMRSAILRNSFEQEK